MGQPQAPQPEPQAVQPTVSAALRSIGEGLINIGGGQRKRPSCLPSEGWLWGLAPVLFAALRVLVVSRGDAETLRALVQNLNITALVLATILPFGAIVSVVCTISMYIASKTSGGQPGRGGPVLFLLLVAMTMTLVLFAMPVWQLIATVATVTGVIVIFVFARTITVRAQQSGKTVGLPVMVTVIGTLLAAAIVPVIYLVGWSGMWLPQERITVLGAKVSSAYILSSDQRWTTYMDERHQVHLVPTTTVTSRDTLGPSKSWSDHSMADNVSAALSAMVRQFASVC
jgi:hypothetical protein